MRDVEQRKKYVENQTRPSFHINKVLSLPFYNYCAQLHCFSVGFHFSLVHTCTQAKEKAMVLIFIHKIENAKRNVNELVLAICFVE